MFTITLDEITIHYSRNRALSDEEEIYRTSNHPRYRQNKPTIFWLHIEKTSSWIDNLLTVWACPSGTKQAIGARRIVFQNDNLPMNFNYWDEIDSYLSETQKEFIPIDMVTKSALLNCSVNFDSHGCGFGYHMPYHRRDMNHTVVTLFRKPMDRLISAFLFDIMIPQGSPFTTSPEVMEDMRSKVRQSDNPIYAYSQTRGIKSCQTKMILGYACGADVVLTENDLIEAKRRLREDLYFFGLTEESVASANLFLAMHHKDGENPLRTNIHDKSFGLPFNFRSNRLISNHNAKSHHKLVHDLTTAGWTDPFDEALYMEASMIFYERCRLYNISVGLHYQTFLRKEQQQEFSDLTVAQKQNIWFQPKPTVFWMHIQKTSSWIGDLLAVWACPDAAARTLADHNIHSEQLVSFSEFKYWDEMNQYLMRHAIDVPNANAAMRSYHLNCSVTFDSYGAGFGYHTPYQFDSMNHTIVTVFRKPIDRLVASFLFDIMLPQGSPFVPDVGKMETIRAEIRNATNPIHKYSETLGIPSCQTKMILGYGCGSDVTLTEEHFVEAKRRLREDVYFFGLSEEPVASANLFFAIHSAEGGNPNRKSIQQSNGPPIILRNSRGNASNRQRVHHMLVMDLLKAGWNDRFDNELYVEASKIFYDRCRKYNIEVGQERHLRQSAILRANSSSQV